MNRQDYNYRQHKPSRSPSKPRNANPTNYAPKLTEASIQLWQKCFTNNSLIHGDELAKNLTELSKHLIEKDLSKHLSNSLLRNILQQLVEIHPDSPDLTDNDHAKQALESNTLVQMQMLRPRFAYLIKRNESSKKIPMKEFYERILDPFIGNAQQKRDLEYLHFFIESLVAFNKFYNDEKN